ncbi:MAG TPA: hybrid sensor histidine kinase/response regulator [Burkholderiales bacterium]|nr:hybrid sensor histidine kinase/response regulator [Burkholderiales bacterium]
MHLRRERRIAKMKPAEHASHAASSLEEELLRMLARQARRIPFYVFLAVLMIGALAAERVSPWIIGAWLALVAAVLVTRFLLIGRLPALTEIPAERRLRIAVVLSAVNGITHGLALGFFPFLPEFERALQSMVMIAMCAGAVVTTAGYMPVLLAYLIPMLAPLSILWAASPGVADRGWIEASTAALLALFGVMLFALGRDAFRLFRDSFEIRLQQAELNRKLEAALEEAEAANRAKTRFLASASHDLRQPIHTLSLFGAALSMRPLDELSRDIVQHINTALQVLTTQLDALLDISKLDAGVVRVNPGPVNLRTFLERVHGDFLPAARAKALTLSLECPAEALAETDPILLERIVRNLLDNAIKYTEKGGVELRVEREPSGFSLSITDTGRGILESEQARVFEEFYQVDNPERDRTKGLGLGLAIVRRLAGLLQIRAEMNSTLGRGTCFKLSLPETRRADVPEPALKEQAPVVAAHVLVVDDEVGIRLGMKTLLEAMGCRATLADGTEHAVAAARAARPDVVLADFRLRGSDSGIAAVRAIRALYPGVPAILVSGDIAADRLREAEEAGIALLHKPVPVEILKRAIAEAVEA